MEKSLAKTSTGILEYMRDCESREWLQRYKAKVKELGKYEAQTWWLKTIQDIETKRGKEAANDLRRRMNEQRTGPSRKTP